MILFDPPRRGLVILGTPWAAATARGFIFGGLEKPPPGFSVGSEDAAVMRFVVGQWCGRPVVRDLSVPLGFFIEGLHPDQWGSPADEGEHLGAPWFDTSGDELSFAVVHIGDLGARGCCCEVGLPACVI